MTEKLLTRTLRINSIKQTNEQKDKLRVILVPTRKVYAPPGA